MTSQQEARAALDTHAVPIYERITGGHFKTGSDVYEVLVNLITNPINDRRASLRASKSAERVRDTLWGYGGGGTSANVTRAVFAALDRDDETDPNWI